MWCTLVLYLAWRSDIGGPINRSSAWHPSRSIDQRPTATSTACRPFSLVVHLVCYSSVNSTLYTLTDEESILPHKGRPYPFHPSYWSTEAWFYPGFVPWKMIAEQVGGLRPFFGCSFGSPDPISEPGVPSYDSTSIEYDFEPVNDCLVIFFQLTLLKVGSGTSSKAAWVLVSIYWDHTSEYQIMEQDYPQRVVLSPAFLLSIPNPDVGPTIFQYVQFSPADYEKGGSPYPRNPPGPP